MHSPKMMKRYILSMVVVGLLFGGCGSEDPSGEYLNPAAADMVNGTYLWGLLWNESDEPLVNVEVSIYVYGISEGKGCPKPSREKMMTDKPVATMLTEALNGYGRYDFQHLRPTCYMVVVDGKPMISTFVGPGDNRRDIEVPET